MADDLGAEIAKASQTIQRYTYPLLRADAQGLPDVFASGVFLGVDDHVYLVTAAHALRGTTTGLLTRGRSHLFQIAGRGTVSRAAGNDHFDIGSVRVDDRIVREHGIEVVPRGMLSSTVEVSNPHSRVICGFPSSMNKQARSLDRNTRTVKCKSYSFFGVAEFRSDFSVFDKSSTTHVGLEISPGTNDAGSHLSSPPSPRGISGGGAWLLPDLSRPHLAFLEGIVIECHKRAKRTYAFSTRLEHVLDFIAQTHKNAA